VLAPRDGDVSRGERPIRLLSPTPVKLDGSP
jgi:hypothetical protein